MKPVIRFKDGAPKATTLHDVFRHGPERNPYISGHLRLHPESRLEREHWNFQRMRTIGAHFRFPQDRGGYQLFPKSTRWFDQLVPDENDVLRTTATKVRRQRPIPLPFYFSP